MLSYLYDYFGYNQPTNFYFLSLIKEPDESWSIHGLWPQNDINKYPQFCNRDAKFEIGKLDCIMDRLEKEWYSNRGSDEHFWEHEYLKHGTCNFNNFDELEYFKTTLDLFDKAINMKLPEEYYNSETNKCLIPVNQSLEFFKIN
jgi:ribonuclease I